MTTQAELDSAFQRFQRALDRRNLIPPGHRLILENGSRTYGRAFRLYSQPPGSTSYHSPPPGAGTDYLGRTKTEAADRLRDRARVLEDLP